MRVSRVAAWLAVGVLCLAGARVAWAQGAGGPETAATTEAAPPPQKIDNAVCLGCHGNEGFAMPGADGKTRPLHVNPERFGRSVHSKRLCVECHKDITEIPHQKGVERKVG
ncbi:MAG: hypothetical protein HY526_03545, partial [Betaproteobacteria bacterium]|nr:hypothetical protein [Betaproteobacteria bacterium]